MSLMHLLCQESKIYYIHHFSFVSVNDPKTDTIKTDLKERTEQTYGDMKRSDNSTGTLDLGL